MKVALRRLSSGNENDADLMDTVKTHGIISHPARVEMSPEDALSKV